MSVLRPACLAGEQPPTEPVLPLGRLRVPFWFAVGRLEKLTDQQLVEQMVDLRVELERRGLPASEVLSD